jgi:hypothetical protein
MARGKQLDNETVYKIMASYFTTNNLRETSRQLNIPLSTVKDIVDKNIKKPEFVQLQTEKKEEFSSKASKIIDKQLELLNRRVDTALENQEELEEMIYEVWNADKDEIDPQAKKGLVSKLSKLQLNSLSEITTSMGTLYDKMRLDRGESTENTNQTIKIGFSEELEELSK